MGKNLKRHFTKEDKQTRQGGAQMWDGQKRRLILLAIRFYKALALVLSKFMGAYFITENGHLHKQTNKQTGLLCLLTSTDVVNNFLQSIEGNFHNRCFENKTRKFLSHGEKLYFFKFYVQ